MAWQAAAAAPPALATDAESTLARMRFSTRLALGATALTLIFILAVGGLSYSVTREQLIHNQDIALENQAALYAQQIGNTLSSIVNTLETLTENALILNALMDSLTRQTALVPFLRDFSRIDNIPVTLLMTDFEGQPIAGNGQLLLETHDWRSQVLKTGKPYAAIGTDAGGDYLFVAEPIFYSPTLSPEGALLCKVALAHAQAVLPGLSERHIALQFTYSQPSAAPSGHSQDPNYRAQVERLSVPAVLQPLQLAVEVAMHSEALNASLNRLILIYAAVGIGLVLVVFALARVGAHYLTRPLRELEVVARSVIASGSLDHRFASHGVFEIEQLGRTFNQMLEQLGRAQRQLHRQAEVEVERSQALAQANAALEQEIRERERMGAALRESEERLTLALGAAHAGAWEWNVATNQVIWSDENYQLMGLTPGSMATCYENWLHCVHPDDRAEIHQQVVQAVEQGSDLNIEFRVLWPNGSVHWVNDIGKMQFDLAGKPVGIYGIQMDITERKRAAVNLRQDGAISIAA